MPLFIVKGFYEVSSGRDFEQVERFEVMHPVEADDDSDAMYKFVKYYERRTSLYSVHYRAEAEQVFETII